MAAPFRFKQSNFRRMLRRYIGIPPVQTPHLHDCMARGRFWLEDSSSRHILSCACTGRSMAAHDEVKFTLAHA
jgi:hypothetical protein